MKKLFLFLVTVFLTAALCGCCLRHDMLPATCTEPSTCSKCGKTEGEPLGHSEVPDEAVEPTCTEAGKTAGSHCETCGEILTAQDTIDPLGHDWEDATFSEPKTCRVCGAAEGDPLGPDLFVNALNPPVPEEELSDAAEKLLNTGTDEELKNISLHKEVKVSGQSHGFGDADEFINQSSLSLIADIEDGQALFSAEAVIRGSRPVHAFLSLDEEEICFTLPGITEKYYRISYDTLRDLAGKYGIFPDPDEAADSYSGAAYLQIRELFQSKAVQELLRKYERILFSLASFHNTTETRTDYELAVLGKTQKCLVLVCRPDAGDWRVMLRKLLSTAAADEDLKNELLIPLAKALYAYDASISFYYSSPEEFAEEMTGSFRKAAENALEEVDSAAEALAEYEFTVAYSGGRVYGLRVLDKDENGISYESYGDVGDGREDVLVFHEDGEDQTLVRSSIRTSGGRTNGRLAAAGETIVLSYYLDSGEDEKPGFDLRLSTPDLNAGLSLEQEEEKTYLRAVYDEAGKGAELEASAEDTEERLTAPEGPGILLSSEKEIEEAFRALSEDVRKAELFGHVWEEATCTEPRTCEVCGETEGEPLGHDWEDRDKAGKRVCRRCGKTE